MPESSRFAHDGVWPQLYSLPAGGLLRPPKCRYQLWKLRRLEVRLNAEPVRRLARAALPRFRRLQSWNDDHAPLLRFRIPDHNLSEPLTPLAWQCAPNL